MGLVKRAADLAFTFRFIRMLVMDWSDWDAVKLGILDNEGKRIKSEKLDTDEKKSAYTPFIRLAANVKRLLSKIPGGETKLGSFAAALYLIKEKYNLSDTTIKNIVEKLEIDTLDFLLEKSEWFVLQNKQLCPGIYRLRESKMCNEAIDIDLNPNDRITVDVDSFPVGNVFGIDIYEATHARTNKKIYIAVNEIQK